MGSGFRSLSSGQAPGWEYPQWPRVLTQEMTQGTPGTCCYIEKDPVSLSLKFSNEEGT